MVCIAHGFHTNPSARQWMRSTDSNVHCNYREKTVMRMLAQINPESQSNAAVGGGPKGPKLPASLMR